MNFEQLKLKATYLKNRVTRKSFLVKMVECVSVAMAACSVVVVTAIIINVPAQKENGQGGYETPAIPVVSEKNAISAENPDSQNYELSYFSYRVKKGDMIGIIADNFDITEDTIISVNNIRSSRLLQIGTYLKIPSLPGILYTVKKKGETLDSIAEKYKVDSAKIAAVNDISVENELSAGNMIFVPDAKLDWVTRQEINGDLFKKPIHVRWYLSSSFGWRKSPFSGARSYHSGVDMACPQGTSIYAAMPGVVTATGFNNVYGNYVIVTHHSGYKTLYGHMSQILAVRGQVINNVNTMIGRVGSTGLSTGPHLHFTVFKNGKQVNPANLWG